MRTAINTCLTLLLLLTTFLTLSSSAHAEEVGCPIGASRLMWWSESIGAFPVLCSNSDSCRYQPPATTSCAHGWCSAYMVSDGTLCEEVENPPECEGDDCVTPTPVPDPTPEPDPDPTPDPALINILKSTCNGGVCKGTVETNPTIMTLLTSSHEWAQFMRRQGYTALTDSLTVRFPKKIIESEKRTQDKIIAKLDKVVSSGVSLLPETKTKLDDIYVEARLANLNAASAMSSNSRIFGIEQLMFSEVMPSLRTLKSDTSNLRSSMSKLSKDTAENFTTTNGKIDSLESTTSGNFDATNTKIDGLADGLKALSEQISAGAGTGSGDVDLSGIESRLKGIQDTLNGVGLSGRAFEGQVDFEGSGLYGSDAIDKLQGEIEQLQEQYQEQMGQFKSLFTFDESQLNAGEYVKHEWTFTFANGRTNSFSSGVFPALLQNANFIAAVLLFLAVLLGIKALTD